VEEEIPPHSGVLTPDNPSFNKWYCKKKTAPFPEQLFAVWLKKLLIIQ